MKVSYNWVKQFTDVTLTIDELVAKIGAQLGAVEEVTYLGARYKGVTVAKVISVADHPNADRLHVCAIDDGGITPDVKRDEQGYVQVVCGAPNVREGLMVAWLPPGSTVPSSFDTDPFVLEARALRGVVSNGMLASAHELAIGDDHSGILELDVEVAPGTPFAEVYELDDYIIDIENKMFTHRPDCFGILGVAREVAGIQQVAFKSPDWYLKPLGRTKPGKDQLPLIVRNEIPELVPRFSAVAMGDVTIKPSPVIIQTYLSRVGIRPINNVVDVTNYLMVLTGQPLHAYDYGKVKAQDSADVATIVVRQPKPGETIALLNGKTIEPRKEAIMIATEQKLIGVGGVMGGADTEVDENTKSIILEVANFDMYSIRRTSMAHGLFTDAVTRFNKGQSPLQNDVILEEAIATMQFVAGASVASDVIDDAHNVAPHAPVELTAAFINERLGLELTAQQIRMLLENVECHVELHHDELRVTPPYWRTDIAIPEDIVEEVGRLYGFDHLPLVLPVRAIEPTRKDALLEMKRQIRATLSRAGANEVLTYSFVHGNLLDKVGQKRDDAFRLSNALSPELQYMRLSLTPSLLERVNPNIKAGYDTFALFEIGKGHHKAEQVVSEDPHEAGLPAEQERVALVITTADKRYQPESGAAFYQARQYAEAVLSGLGITEYVLTADLPDGLPVDAAWNAPFADGRAAAVIATVQGQSNVLVGLVGEYSQSVTKALKLPKASAGFEFDICILLALAQEQQASRYQPLPRFPSTSQDICLKVDASVAYDSVYALVRDTLEASRPEQSRATLEPVDIYQREDDNGHKQITLRLTIAHYEKTMIDTEVNAIVENIAAVAHDQLGAERI